jgi:hypothetical protein
LDAAFKEAGKSLADAASAPKGVGWTVAIPGRGEPRWGCRIVGSRRHCRGVIPPPCAAISRRGHCTQRTDPIGSPPIFYRAFNCRIRIQRMAGRKGPRLGGGQPGAGKKLLKAI